MKVGELARRSGVSVRTLHYYEEIGLLTPSEHTSTGHRLYAMEDVKRLQQIVSLGQLGLSLAEIGACLAQESFDPAEVVDRHLARVREQIDLQRLLCDRLERVSQALRAADSPLLDDLLQAIEVTKMLERYTPEQRALFEERARIVGQERIRLAHARGADDDGSRMALPFRASDVPSQHRHAFAYRHVHVWRSGGTMVDVDDGRWLGLCCNVNRRRSR